MFGPKGPEDAEKAAIKALKRVIDPHTDTDVFSMGLVHEVSAVSAKKGFDLTITFVPDTPVCPHIDRMMNDMRTRLEGRSWVNSLIINTDTHKVPKDPTSDRRP